MVTVLRHSWRKRAFPPARFPRSAGTPADRLEIPPEVPNSRVRASRTPLCGGPEPTALRLERPRKRRLPIPATGTSGPGRYCPRSPASILTGQDMHPHRLVDSQPAVPEGATFFPQYLQQPGCTTAFLGKYILCPGIWGANAFCDLETAPARAAQPDRGAGLPRTDPGTDRCSRRWRPLADRFSRSVLLLAAVSTSENCGDRGAWNTPRDCITAPHETCGVICEPSQCASGPWPMPQPVSSLAVGRPRPAEETHFPDAFRMDNPNSSVILGTALPC